MIAVSWPDGQAARRRLEHVALAVAEQNSCGAVLPALKAAGSPKRNCGTEIVGGRHGFKTSHAAPICSCARDTRASIFIASSKSPAVSFAIAPVSSLMIRLIHTSCTWWMVMNSTSSCASVSGWAASNCSRRR